MDGAAFSNNIRKLNFLKKLGKKPTYHAIDWAAERGHMEVLKWLKKHFGHIGCSTYAMSNAAAFGRLDVLNWLKDNYGHIGPSDRAMNRALLKGQLKCMKWLQTHYGHVRWDCTYLDVYLFLCTKLECIIWVLEHPKLFNVSMRLWEEWGYSNKFQHTYFYILAWGMKGSNGFHITADEQDTMDTMDTLFLLGDPCPLGEPRMNESTLVKKRSHDFHEDPIHLKRPCRPKNPWCKRIRMN